MLSSAAILKAVRRQDIPVLNDLITRGLGNLPPLPPGRVQSIWEACWATWEKERQAPRTAHRPTTQVTLGDFMAGWRAAHPWLPSHPAWTAVGDPENE